MAERRSGQPATPVYQSRSAGCPRDAPAAARGRHPSVSVQPGRPRRPGRGAVAAVSEFTTYREGSLHASLKARYAAIVVDARVEAAVDGFVVDVVGRDELVEIQTASFASVSRKLQRLVIAHRVVLVHPIAIEKWLVLVDADGVILRRRRSPKRGLALDLFDELVHIAALMAEPGFRIELPLIREEEIRGPIPEGAAYRYPRQWWRLDRRLVDVVETLRLDTPADLLGLLPMDLPDPSDRARWTPVTPSGREATSP